MDLSAYSPISEPEGPAAVMDSGTNKSKSSIVMTDNTINASISSSLAAAQNLDDVDDVIKIDANVPDIDHNLENTKDKSIVDSQNVDNSVLNNVKIEPLPSFDVNVLPLPHLSITRRISTAYKYYSFPRKAVPEKRQVSEAHGSDEETSKPEEVIENSFPIASAIMQGWQEQGKSFSTTLKKALVMDDPEVNESVNDSKNEQNDSENSSDSKKKKSDAKLFSKNTPSILKNAPKRKQGDFYYHEEKFGQFVQLDSNIELLTPSGFDPSSHKLQVNLSEEEVRNMQTAMSFGLHAESHLSSYITASRKAINKALLKLDPETYANEITALQDAKHMLYGAANAVDQSVKMMVYIHAGLTATLRTDFLKTHCPKLPTPVIQGLMHAQFGGSALFNSQIGKFTKELELHRQKEHHSTLQTAVTKSMQSQQPKSSTFVPPSVPPNQGQGNRGGFNASRGRGGHGSFQHSRGAGNAQTNSFQQPRHNNNRGGYQGNRGKPRHNNRPNNNSRKRKN